MVAELTARKAIEESNLSYAVVEDEDDLMFTELDQLARDREANDLDTRLWAEELAGYIDPGASSFFSPRVVQIFVVLQLLVLVYTLMPSPPSRF